MEITAQAVLDAFGRLSADEQHQVITAILTRARDFEWPPLDEETIDGVADDSFIEYDLREAADAEA